MIFILVMILVIMGGIVFGFLYDRLLEAEESISRLKYFNDKNTTRIDELEDELDFQVSQKNI